MGEVARMCQIACHDENISALAGCAALGLAEDARQAGWIQVGQAVTALGGGRLGAASAHLDVAETNFSGARDRDGLAEVLLTRLTLAQMELDQHAAEQLTEKLYSEYADVLARYILLAVEGHNESIFANRGMLGRESAKEWFLMFAEGLARNPSSEFKVLAVAAHMCGDSRAAGAFLAFSKGRRGRLLNRPSKFSLILGLRSPVGYVKSEERSDDTFKSWLASALVQVRASLDAEFPPSVEASEAWELGRSWDTDRATAVAKGFMRVNLGAVGTS
jgi:hypothetical protein